MAKVNFLYRSIKPKGNLIVRLLHSYDKVDLVLGGKTKCYVDKEFWKGDYNIANLKDIEKDNEQTRINDELNAIEDIILKAFYSTPINEVNKEWLQRQIDSYYNPETNKTNWSDYLVEYADKYLGLKKNKVKKSTYNKINIAIDKLKAFEISKNKKYLIKDVDEEFLNDFIDYYEGLSYATNTIKKDFTVVKSICRHARIKNKETSVELDVLTINEEVKDKIYLNPEEIDKIENKTFDSDRLNNAKDWLIISLYTGQRVSDLFRFNKEMLRIDGGVTYIDFIQHKTTTVMGLPLHPKVLEILKKNKGDFPRKISDQKFNLYIKEVCREAGITQMVEGYLMCKEKKRHVKGDYPKYKLIASHIGRKSWATNNIDKANPSVLMAITGHKSEAQLYAYVCLPKGNSAKEIVKTW